MALSKEEIKILREVEYCFVRDGLFYDNPKGCTIKKFNKETEAEARRRLIDELHKYGC